MFESPVTDTAASLVAARSDAALALTQVSLTSSADEELIELLRVSEEARRREAFFDQTLIAELTLRGVASRFGCSSTAALLRDVARVSPSEAAARVRASMVAGPRQSLDGQTLEPLLPVAATAQAEGVISPSHLKVITDVLEKVPAAARAEWAEQIEVSLVTHAAEHDPVTLAKIGRRLIDLLDPDGTLSDDADRARRRDLSLLIHPDGTGTLRGTTDAHLTELLAVVFDSLASPKRRPPTPDDADPDAAADGQAVAGDSATEAGPGVDEDAELAASSDTRTPGQRRHDALIEVLRPVVSSGQLPATGGIPATILLTATVEQWESGKGLVRTGHGALISVPTAQRIAGGDAKVVPVILGKAKEIIAYGTGQRLFTPAQRLAMIARDGGCSWPGCDRPPSQCEAHHMTPWSITKQTTVDDGAMLCGGDHSNLDSNGWTCIMINGIPHYVPPPWLDPEQKPRRNRMHTPLDVG